MALSQFYIAIRIEINYSKAKRNLEWIRQKTLSYGPGFRKIIAIIAID